ncbi:MAG TPA: DUF1206 domain-containing protein [Pyrinomonadaceae bacterium]
MDLGNQDRLGEAVRNTERAAEEAVRNPWTQKITRFGFLVKGCLFVVIGASAVMVAAGLRGGQITDPVGAMSAIAQFRYGHLVLIMFTVGAVGHGLWNILRGVADVDDNGSGIKGIATRCVAVGVGVFYFILSFVALSILLGNSGGASNGGGAKTVAWAFLSLPFGGLVVMLIGVGFWVAAINESYQGLTGKFQENYRSWKLGPLADKLTLVLGVVSFTTRSVLYCFVGYFFVMAAAYGDHGLAAGIDGALLALAEAPFGFALLLVAGVGLTCHGILAVFEAKYRRIC